MTADSIDKRLKSILNSGGESEMILKSRLFDGDTTSFVGNILSNKNRNSDDLLYGGLTVSDFVYDILRVDPNVIAATDFARAQDIEDVFKFSVYADQLDGLSPESFAGHIANVKGYVAERVAAQYVQSQGFEVEFPDAANQEGFDLLVNDIPFQVKCLTSPQGVFEHLDKNPDIPVFINMEIADSFNNFDNVYPLPILSNIEITELTEDSFNSGAEVLDFEIPYISAAIAVGQNTIKLMKGQTDAQSAAINAAYSFAGRVAGAEAGSVGLAWAGGLLGPYGVVVGGLAGAVVGGVYGRRTSDWIKRKIHASDEYEVLMENLSVFLGETSTAAGNSLVVLKRKIIRTKDTIEDHRTLPGSIKKSFMRRLDDEITYQTNKCNQIQNAHEDPLLLGKKDREIGLASVNGIRLSIQAKVHPAQISSGYQSLTESITKYMEKMKKLS
jgi:hypothetical protein